MIPMRKINNKNTSKEDNRYYKSQIVANNESSLNNFSLLVITHLLLLVNVLPLHWLIVA